MGQSEYEIVAKMSRHQNKSDHEIALDFVNQLVVSGVESTKAITHVAAHFTGVGKERLARAWEQA